MSKRYNVHFVQQDFFKPFEEISSVNSVQCYL